MANNGLDIEVHNTANFSDEEKAKFKRAIAKTKEVLNSKEFRDRFLRLPLVQTNGMSNIEIFELLMSGKDKFNKAEDKDIDVYITMYYSWKNTIGYTYPSTWWTWINRKFFTGFEDGEVGGNVVHEYMHNLGFGHLKASDKNSVPYATGYLVRDMIREMDGKKPKPSSSEEPMPKKGRWVCKRKWYLFFKKVCYWKVD